MTDEKRKPDQEIKGVGAESGARPQDAGLPSSVDQILQARMQLENQQAALDKMLKDKFQKNVCVMFTDIKGSTSYFETYGDVEGRAMVQRHNSMLFPKIQERNGKVIKTIGDAIMATFEDPAQGVKAAIEMQKVLAEHNLAMDQKHKRILVRIGLNFGPAVVEEKDVFGDAVNVAARVESKADGGEIMISESVYKEVRDDDEILVRFFGDVECKGKAEKVKLYRVVWSEEQLVAEGDFKKAATRRTVDMRGKVVRGRVIELVLSRDGKALKVSVMEHQRGEEKTVTQYDVVKLDEKLVKTQCDEVVSLLNRSNKRGKISKEILRQLKSAGQILFDSLLSPEAKEKIIATQAEHLTIRMDDQLVHVPWELFFDGKQFFCQRFAMGRIVATRQKVANVPDRHIAKPLRMLVLADPRSDLPASNQEGLHIRDQLEKEYEFINVKLKASDVPVNYVKSKIRDFDIIHYAGHADYNRDNPAESGWLLADGKLSSEDFKSMAGAKPMPALVFANACQSGQTEEWKLASDYEKDIFGLANAFLVSGVQHYIGTFWDILDDPGHDFAMAFYRATLEGASVGECVRRARLALIDKYGEETIVWASYMLYGDPAFSYLADVATAEEAVEEPAPPPGHAVAQAGGQAQVFRGAEAAARPAQKSNLGLIAGAVVAALLALVLVLGYLNMKPNPDKISGQAYDKLAAKDYPGAIAIFMQLTDRPDAKAIGVKGLIAVGLAASQAGDKDTANQAYAAAHQADAMSADAAVNYGQSLLAMGKDAEAQEAFNSALKADPNNVVANALLLQVASRLAKAEDVQQQEMVNQEVGELIDMWKSGKLPPPAKVADDWTSRPVTLTFLDFVQVGNGAMEGEMDFLKIALAQALDATGRVTVVERDKIDRIISELKLSASDLTNEQTRNRLGNLFGAKLIATGKFIRHQDEAQVLLQLVETETSLVNVAVTQDFAGADKAGDIAKKTADALVAKIKEAYPIQGLIKEIAGEDVKLNLGELAGLTKGMQLEVLDADLLPVGLLEVTAVAKDAATAKFVQKPPKPAVGAKVREVLK